MKNVCGRHQILGKHHNGWLPRCFFPLFFSVALLAALLLPSCGDKLPSADFVFLNATEPESLDPAIITGQPEGRLVAMLFEGLTSRDKYGNTGPGMSDRWTISPDGLTYRFHIRDGAKWSNGTALTARDFAISWERVLNPMTASDYAEILFYVDGAEDYNKGKLSDFNRVGVKSDNQSWLEVRLRAPTAFFLDLCAFTTTYPVHIPSIKKHGRDWIKPGNLVSNGAFTLSKWRINDRIRFEKNPHYWRKETVAMQTVDALPISHATTAFNFYHTGAAQLLLDKGNVPPMLIRELSKRPDFHSFPILATYFYRFNLTRPPFDDPRVRKAIAYAIDKDYIVKRITRLGEPVTGSFTPSGLSGYTPPHGIGYSPDEARRLLAEAGYPEGRNFPPFTLLYNRTEQDENIAAAFQSMMKNELNIRVELRNQEWKVYLNSLSQLQYEMARSSWVGDYADPNTFLDCFITGRGNNRTGWSHAKYDSLVNEANRTVESKKRMELLAKAEKILVEQELPIIPVFHFVGASLFDSRRLKGFEPNLIDEHPIREMSLEKKLSQNQ